MITLEEARKMVASEPRAEEGKIVFLGVECISPAIIKIIFFAISGRV